MPTIQPTLYPQRLVNAGAINALIATGQSQSTVVDCGGASPVAIRIPTGFTSADLTFKASLDGSPASLFTLTDNQGAGNNLSIAAAAQLQIPLDPTLFAGVKFLQILCSVAQAADTNIEIVMGPLWQ